MKIGLFPGWLCLKCNEIGRLTFASPLKYSHQYGLIVLRAESSVSADPSRLVGEMRRSLSYSSPKRVLKLA